MTIKITRSYTASGDFLFSSPLSHNISGYFRIRHDRIIDRRPDEEQVKSSVTGVKTVSSGSRLLFCSYLPS